MKADRDGCEDMTEYLCNRLAELDAEIAERQAWRVEVERTLAVWLACQGRGGLSKPDLGLTKPPDC